MQQKIEIKNEIIIFEFMTLFFLNGLFSTKIFNENKIC